MSSTYPPIILYNYPGSPFGKRVAWYLQLRGIPYKSCEQPSILPRPDLNALGVNYRRIPVCSIGRDIYVDTRLILAKLETLAGTPKLGAAAIGSNPEHAALERLLSFLTVTGGAFQWAVALLPPKLPIFNEPKWVADRSGLFPGTGKLAPPTPMARAEAVANMRVYVGLLETTVLADGREWVLGATPGPSLADIESVWPLHWLWTIPGALPKDQLSAVQFPRVFAWVKRFDQVVRALGGGVEGVSGKEAARTIVGAPYFEEAGRVVESESVVQTLGLKQGCLVVVTPTDYGMTHKDTGSLVSIDEKQVVIEITMEVEGSPTVRLHAPRFGFRVVEDKSAKVLNAKQASQL